jgi:predicted lipase
MKYPLAKYHVTGHSLGGAMATLFASELALLGVKPILITVGSPRVGDSDFYDWFSTLKLTHSRLTNKKDMAPHLPPLRFNFEHVNTEIWYKDGVNYIICADVKGEDKTCSASVVNTNLNDH